jgi:hypothetical protein
VPYDPASEPGTDLLTPFPASFVFSTARLPDVAGFESVELAYGYIKRTPDLPLTVRSAGDSQIILIGYALDLRERWQSEKEIADALLQTAERSGLAAALALIDSLLGRFAVVFRLAGRWAVANDATAMRAVYYHCAGGPNSFLLSSHSTHLGRLTRGRSLRDFFRNYRFGLPGHHAPYEEVRILPPNFVLWAQEGRLERFWPRQPREEVTVDDAYRIFEPLLLKAAELVSGRWWPAVSLTAGIDSRVTFAAFRKNSRAVFFTYDRGASDAVDLAVARDMCSRYEAAHKRIRMRGGAEGAGVLRVLDEMDDYRHIVAVCPSYAAHFSDGPWVHVRSNILEIGRAFWRKQGLKRQFEPARMARLLMHRGETRPDRAEAQAFAEQEFGLMYEALGYRGPDDPTLAGFDGWDLFYWEHRMATWHSQLLMGSDFGFDTVVLFNCRDILLPLLSLPLDDRLSGSVLHKFIAEHAEGVHRIPINPSSYP